MGSVLPEALSYVEYYKLAQEFTPAKPTKPFSVPAKILTDPSIESLNCPLSLEKFVDPVVDRCGHSFEKAHIHAYCKIKSKDGKTFPCPINPSNILNIDEVVRNYNLCQVIEETNKEIIKSTSELSKRLDSLETRCEIQEHNFKLLKDSLDQYQRAYKIHKHQQKIRKKQLENLRNMTFYDRVNTVFFYSYLNTIQNRGISEFELSYLQIHPLQNKP